MGSDADRAFLAGIDRQLQTSRTGEAVIYVPGYRVTFDQVMVLMGSWAHYLGRSSPVVAFSWPTGHLGLELPHRLSARARLRAGHRAADRAGRRRARPAAST